MHFKGFRIGKRKEKNENEKTTTTTSQIAVLEEPLSDSTKNLKQTAKQLKKSSGKIGKSEENADISTRPHGPIGELEVVSENDLTDKNDGTSLEESGEEVKLVEVSAEAVTSLKAKAAISPKAEAATTPKAKAATSPKAEVRRRSHRLAESRSCRPKKRGK